MLNQYVEDTNTPVRGKINIGCDSRRAKCNTCKREVLSIKPYDTYICPECEKADIAFLPDSKSSLIGLPYFIMPHEVKGQGGLPEKLSELTIIPASQSIEKTMPTSFARYASQGVRYCSSLDGKKALRYDKNTRTEKEFTCSDQCKERLDKSCKPTGTFYFIIPALDMNSVWAISTSSDQSIRNVISALTKFSNEGKIIRAVRKGDNFSFWKLRIIQKKRKGTQKLYSIVQLFPPQVPFDVMNQLQISQINSCLQLT